MAIDRGKYLELFFSEVDEQLTALNSLLVKLESNLNDLDSINEIFRLTHTVKGNAAAMGFEGVSKFAHQIEDVFDLLRNSKLELGSDVADVIFQSLDELRNMLEYLRKTGAESEKAPHTGKVLEKIAAGHADWKGSFRKKGVEEQTTIMATARVPMKLLDNIINLIGELIINISRLEMLNQELKSKELKNTITYIKRNVSEIQYNIMDARLVPLASIFDRFPRMVRDIAQDEGKEVALDVSGTDIQLDSKVVEKIKTPIVQIVRNAISHGIESPESRDKSGKPRIGQISIEAARDKGRVKVAISDDGQGIDARKVCDAAVKLGMVPAEHAKHMDNEEILNLIFEPGFTTASKGSKISGRGVGMDAVRAALASIGGTIQVESRLNKGTTFILDVPMSIAIIKCLLCEVRDKYYAFPITVVNAIRNVPRGEVHRMNGENAFSFEERLVQLLDVASLLSDAPADFSECDDFNVVIANAAGKMVGFAVDKLLREADLVVKPLQSLTDVRSVSGASLLGDGSIVLILDAGEMVKQASLGRERS